MNDKPKEAGDVVAMILVGDMPGASYKVEFPGLTHDTMIELSDAQEEYWALANALDFVAGDWEDGACFTFGRSSGETLCTWCSKAIPLTSEGRSLYCPSCGTVNHRTSGEPVTLTETVVHHWSREHGDCLDCGAPAAYSLIGQTNYLLCSVCAATHAADGESIIRIEDAVHFVYLTTWDAKAYDGSMGYSVLGTMTETEARERYLSDVQSWANENPPWSVGLRLVEMVVGDEVDDEELEEFFAQQDTEALAYGAGGRVLMTTLIEAAPIERQ